MGYRAWGKGGVESRSDLPELKSSKVNILTKVDHSWMTAAGMLSKSIEKDVQEFVAFFSESSADRSSIPSSDRLKVSTAHCWYW